MVVQNNEVLTSSRQQYLLIPKTGCSSVSYALETKYKDLYITNKINPSRESISWTVFRDPLHRFISAVSYDMLDNNIPITETSLDLLIKTPEDIKRYIYGVTKGQGSAGFNDERRGHSMLQTLYLFDNNIDILVRFEDLDKFMLMHFPKIEAPLRHLNIGEKAVKSFVKTFLKNNRKSLNIINNYLEVDRFTFERFKASNKVWNWADGSIF
jgi:hypothetical protein